MLAPKAHACLSRVGVLFKSVSVLRFLQLRENFISSKKNESIHADMGFLTLGFFYRSCQ